MIFTAGIITRSMATKQSIRFLRLLRFVRNNRGADYGKIK